MRVGWHRYHRRWARTIGHRIWRDGPWLRAGHVEMELHLDDECRTVTASETATARYGDFHLVWHGAAIVAGVAAMAYLLAGSWAINLVAMGAAALSHRLAIMYD